MALLSDPELLILDEPTTGMDVEGRRSFWGAIRHDTAEGRTVLFVSHNLQTIRQMPNKMSHWLMTR